MPAACTPRPRSASRPKLTRFLDWCPEHRGHTIYGPVAFLRSDPDVATYAERQAPFVTRATGQQPTMVNAADFKPRVFP